ncbi:GIY-YIG nuclease family protein [Agromyces sp. ISL-38]|uniref:GIY-YIG nuclease family protein n=1 Tax=Agromyces sp. ISL-38 TaxID=2819107 RepID=UPI001BEC95FD|nr:GIY-YIG nuclease family protein [Agromyces sp. ISL-38]MBT2500693.1 GIY-YIG nuclease family protein [Agromyces sp. ISL-38]
MPFMYILECADGSYYVGSRRNLEHRLEQHSIAAVHSYTSSRLPVKLVYAEEFAYIHDAYSREKQVQGWSRAKRRALINGRIGELPKLSRRGASSPDESG